MTLNLLQNLKISCRANFSCSRSHHEQSHVLLSFDLRPSGARQHGSEQKNKWSIFSHLGVFLPEAPPQLITAPGWDRSQESIKRRRAGRLTKLHACSTARINARGKSYLKTSTLSVARLQLRPESQGAPSRTCTEPAHLQWVYTRRVNIREASNPDGAGG